MATRLFDHMYFKELNDLEIENNESAVIQANFNNQDFKCECITEFVKLC